MNSPAPTLQELLAHLQAQGLISPENVSQAAESLAQQAQKPKDPIAIRILLGIGAWFAAVFLIIFLGVAGLIGHCEGALTCGAILLGAAVFITRLVPSIFLAQFSLAMAFAGNALVLFGIAASFGFRNESGLAITQAIICAIVYPLFPSSIYRYLSPIFLAILTTAWISMDEMPWLFHLLVAAETLLAGWFFTRKKLASSLRPLAYSTATLLPATLLFLNLSQGDIAHYLWHREIVNSLWPSSLLISAGLVYLYFHLAGGKLKRLREKWLILAIGFTILLGVLTTPGILVVIGLLVLGYGLDDRKLTCLGYTFLPGFLVLYYYAMNIHLAHKAYIVAGSGIVLLAVRWMAGRLEPAEVAK